MLKKIRRNFILAAMTSFISVMLLLLTGINVVSFLNTRANEDRILDRLAGISAERLKPPNPKLLPMQNVPGMGPEGKHMLRFFIVEEDANGALHVISKDFIASVDENTAMNYAKAAAKKGVARGYIEEFRYVIAEDKTIFLNVSPDLHAMKMFLFTSVIIGFLGTVAVFALVLFSSKRVIKPFARNMEMQKQFITDAGHELRTPLASIATSVDILAMEDAENEWIDTIRKQTIRLSKLVDQLVQLSKLDEEAPNPEREELPLHEIGWEIAESFKPREKTMNRTFTVDIADNVKILGNEADISQMLSILLDNAFKYADERGLISLKIAQNRNSVIIEVWNTLSGIDITKLDRIFDRFFRMEESHSRSTGGNGIGLSIARSIVEQHGGKIVAKSDDGNSLCIKVTLRKA